MQTYPYVRVTENWTKTLFRVLLFTTPGRPATQIRDPDTQELIFRCRERAEEIADLTLEHEHEKLKKESL